MARPQRKAKAETPERIDLLTVRAELKSDIAAVGEAVNKVAKQQTKIVEQIDAVRSELKGDMSEIKSDISEIKGDIVRLDAKLDEVIALLSNQEGTE
ncbi:MAG: hypothetical protein OXT69_01145 [Candidatus Poribacteria bacterium]|nr:hypothetical protein [Candidatus Poribacteria bacterium]